MLYSKPWLDLDLIIFDWTPPFQSGNDRHKLSVEKKKIENQTKFDGIRGNLRVIKKYRHAQNLATNEKSTILIQSSWYSNYSWDEYFYHVS